MHAYVIGSLYDLCDINFANANLETFCYFHELAHAWYFGITLCVFLEQPLVLLLCRNCTPAWLCCAVRIWLVIILYLSYSL